MEFKPEFFEDEIRNGFLVPAMLKRGWAATLEVLSDIDAMCQKNGITYFAHLGTLIGTVRHHGFIPWDDDIDICMKREDYMKFLALAPTQLPSNYRIFNVFNKDRHDASLCGILNSAGVNIEPAHLEKYHGCGATVGIDIFILDYMPNDPEERAQHLEALDFVRSLIELYDGLSDEDKAEQLTLVRDVLGFEIIANDPANTVTFQLGKLLESLCMMYTAEEADDICNMMTWQGINKRYFKKSWFESVVYGDFEGFKMPMPNGWHEYLTLVYGDYMKECRFGAAHQFPHFESGYYNARAALGNPEYIPEFLRYPRQLEVEPENILFIPFRQQDWTVMKPEYDRVRAAYPEANIQVMPVPYYIKDIYGHKIGEEIIEELGDGTEITDYTAVDLGELKPEIIYFQNPYDTFHEKYESKEGYYCEELWTSCGELRLIPINQMPVLEPSDGCGMKMLRFACRYPGLFSADKIIVDAEKRTNYVDALVDFVGDASRPIWESKVK